MSAVLALLGRVLAQLATILGILDDIKSLVGASTAAVEHSPYQIETTVTSAGLSIANPTYGLAAAHTERLAILEAIQNIRLDTAEPHLPTLTDIVAMLNAGVPVTTLPPVAPPGYGGADASEVWTYPLASAPGTLGNTADQVVSSLYCILSVLNHAGSIRAGGNPWFVVDLEGAYLTYSVTSYYAPIPDWTDMRASDTVLSWLQRTCLEYTWSYDSDSDTCTAYPTRIIGGATWRLRCLMHQSDFDMIRLGYPAAANGNTAPVWPGLAAVTLGTQQALSDGLTVTEDCDGLLINIQTTPPGTGRYMFGENVSWTHVGAVSFQSDNGEFETAQNFSFKFHVLSPRAMKRAVGYTVRTRSGVSGTVTPWTIT